MDLIEVTAYTSFYGSEVFEFGEGKTLTIETSPSGSEYLSYECPAGKVVTATISVSLKIEDA